MKDIDTRGKRFRWARQCLPEKKGTLSAVYAATGVPSSKIKDLENDAIERSVGYQDIIKLAAHYKVSLDWLIGGSEFTEIKYEQASAKELGLSEDAIRNLQDIKERSSGGTDLLTMMNYILSSDQFSDLLTGFSDINTSVKIRAKNLNKLHSDSMRWTEGSQLIMQATGGLYDVISREEKELVIETKLVKFLQNMIADLKSISLPPRSS